MTSHRHHLHDIANRLNAYGLTLNMAKCSLSLSEITVLGYKLSQNGIVFLEDKIIIIKKFPTPSTVKELRRFLGLVTYQRRFLNNAAFILNPLNFLLKDHVKNDDVLDWNAQATDAFLKIKDHLANTSHLAHPKPNAVLLLKCDATNVSLGACLEQVYDDKTEVLGYFFKSLQDPQKRYSTYDLKLLSVFSSVKYFEYMLLDKKFVIFY